MILWRISNFNDLKGLGGLRASGRWHLAGQPVVYLAEHPALAFLEVLVHLEIGVVEQLPMTYQLLKVEAPDDMTVAVLGEEALPDDWRLQTEWTQSAGTEWLAGGTTALLKVPSAVMPYSSNLLLNPAHGDAARVRILDAIQVRHDEGVLALLSGGRI